MSSILNKIKQTRSGVANEFNQVNANPIIKSIVQSFVVIIDILIMFVLIWNMFALFIPSGSWINFVDGNSMYPTMHDGQIVFTEMGVIKRGDIITTKAPATVLNEYPDRANMVMVKRVIGVPGDNVVIDKNGVYVNGAPISEEYLTEEARLATYVEGKINSIMLGKNEYFVMGDNRDVSYDSRYFGAITTDELLYKQSNTPTANFYLKLILILIVLVLDICLYSLIEFILTELAYIVFLKPKIKDSIVSDSKNAANNITSEVENLKGDN